MRMAISRRAVPVVWLAVMASSRLGAGLQAPSVPSVDQILERYLQALGGKANVQQVTSRVEEGIREAMEWETKGPFQRFGKAPDKSLTVTNYEDYGLIQTGHNGKTGWLQDTNTGIRDIVADELAQMKRNTHFYREIDIKGLYPILKLLGKESVGGRETYKIEATPAEGLPDTLYFDTETGLLARFDSQEAIPNGRETTVTLYEDYREVDGIKIPFVIHQSKLDFSTRTVLSTVKHNVPIEDARFEKPAK